MEKASLPIKTKIATWWMIVMGGIFLIGFLILLITLFISGPGTMWTAPLWFVYLSLSGIALLGIFPVFLLGFFLLKKRKWVWKFAIIILSLEMTVWLSYSFTPFIFF